MEQLIIELINSRNNQEKLFSIARQIIDTLITEARNTSIEGSITQALDKISGSYLKIVESAIEKISNETPIILAVWAGPPGVGKGTNIQAILESCEKHINDSSENEWQAFTSLLTSKTSTIKTGTGGIFNFPQNEYAEVFENLIKLVQEISSRGELVPDAIVSFAVELMILVRILSGSTRIMIDIWPRTVGQLNTLAQLLKVAKNIQTEFLLIHLLSETEIANLNSFSVEESLKMLTSAVTEIEAMLPKINTVENYSIQRTQQIELLANLSKDNYYIREAIECMNRIANRVQNDIELQREIRVDDYPSVQLKRFMEYLNKTAKLFLESRKVTEVIDISGVHTPEAVVENILKILASKYSPKVTEISQWNALVEDAKLVARRIVEIGK